MHPRFIPPTNIKDIPLVSTDACYDERIIILAKKYAHPAVLFADYPNFLKKNHLWSMQFNQNKLGLHYRQANIKALSVDFVTGALAYRRAHGGGARSQLIARAVGYTAKNPPRVLDLTAGLGRDAFVLAALGCQVTLLERCSVLAALIDDGLQRLQRSDTACRDRMNLTMQCALDFLNEIKPGAASQKTTINPIFDVIYLDPMFPDASFKNASVKKDMRILQALLANEPNCDLLHPALALKTKRVVVKRPQTAPTLKGRPPDHRYQGKSCRFDVYHNPLNCSITA